MQAAFLIMGMKEIPDAQLLQIGFLASDLVAEAGIATPDRTIGLKNGQADLCLLDRGLPAGAAGVALVRGGERGACPLAQGGIFDLLH
jgi:hypothetical protein